MFINNIFAAGYIFSQHLKMRKVNASKNYLENLPKCGESTQSDPIETGQFRSSLGRNIAHTKYHTSLSERLDDEGEFIVVSAYIYTNMQAV